MYEHDDRAYLELPEPSELKWTCPICGEILYQEDTIYIDEFDGVKGCIYCVRERQAGEHFDRA